MEIKYPSSSIQKFRELEKKLTTIDYPNNTAQKIMGIILQNLESFELIMTRAHEDWQRLKEIAIYDKKLRDADPTARSYPAHPNERFVYSAIRVDVESLFVYGTILVNKTLLLLHLYLPDQLKKNKKGKDQYSGLSNFYYWLADPSNQLSELALKLKNKLFGNIKWLYAVLRFYRNEFIEHMDKDYQQGMSLGPNFGLHSFGWDDITESTKIILEDLKRDLKQNNCDFLYHQSDRYFIQVLFDGICDVPHALLEKALKIIEEVGAESPTSEVLISMVENYFITIFDEMIENFDKSEFAKFKINLDVTSL